MPATSKNLPETGDSVITSNAMEKIQCFYDDADDMIYRLAEQIARQKTGTAASNPVVIELAHVMEAGEKLRNVIKTLFPEDGEIMMDCFDGNCGG